MPALQMERPKKHIETVVNCLFCLICLDGLIGERDLPALLNRAELQMEQHNKHIETDGEAAVTNPPPSPATDGRENSSDGVPELSDRQLNSYDDDFIDTTCDNMDVF